MEKQLFLASILSFWKLWATIVDMLSMQLRNLASVRVLSHCSEEPLKRANENILINDLERVLLLIYKK